MRITVHYYAAAREAAGLDRESLDLDEADTVASLKALLTRRHPDLAGVYAGLRFAVDERFASEGTPLHEGAVVALIPPVGGG